ncbi:flagellar protein FlgN [Pelotomaculum isophthalicicum JI]|uniref:Flagellar protein FlgN n=1 Tax=Pelotomaculum isophthalicicum JI TaxID=947010 RepID=A0A9X4JWH9_9FIRM|nr:flagellar protein FlgN [Pelotomaculum isophthalicicum]MDF9409133.1 flagellar protein FlgN [Pelotomaculum isophthalicicum JI]
MNNRPGGKTLDLLVDCLTREDGLMAGLYSVCEEQMAALRDNDVGAIEEAVKRVNSLIADMTAAEEERQRIQAALDTELGLSPGSRLADVLPYASGEIREKLDILLKGMRSKADLLREVNKINAIMTRRALTLNRIMLNAINQGEGLTYGVDGGVGQGSFKKLLVNKTV